MRVFVTTLDNPDPVDERVYLNFHGRAPLWGSGANCATMGKFMVAMVGAKIWSVDYRMPPDHPYLSPLFGDFTKGFPPIYMCSRPRPM